MENRATEDSLDSNVFPIERGSNDGLDEEQRRSIAMFQTLNAPTQVASLSQMEANKPLLGREEMHEGEESVDHSDIDVSKMGQQLREVHKEVKERWMEKDHVAGASQHTHTGELDPDDNETFKAALSCVPKYVVDINYVHQVEISSILNAERDDRKDYRLVAAHLGCSNRFIGTVSNVGNPMMSVFECAGGSTGRGLVEALYQCSRFDAMRLIVKHYFKPELRQSVSQDEKRQQFKVTSLGGSLEENILASTCEERVRASSDPVKESTRGDSVIPMTSAGQVIHNPSTPHEDSMQSEDDDDWQDAIEGAKEFWDKIKPEKGTNKKKLRNIKKNFEALFENEQYTELPSTWKLIAHALHQQDGCSGSSLVSPEYFRQMLAFFGPPTADVNGCIKTAGQLREKSRRFKQGSREKISWFAGLMNQEETRRYLDDEPRGSYLVRFSTSKADEGWFVLAVKTEKAGVAELHIEQNWNDKKRRFHISEHSKKFETLGDLIEYFELNRLVNEPEGIGEYLVSPCSGLPLNAICTGYKTAKGKH